MSWIVLIVVGVALILLARYAGIPFPGGNIAMIIGWLFVVVGVIFFIIWLMPQPGTDESRLTPTQYTYHVNHK
jgi:hypothetical protein